MRRLCVLAAGLIVSLGFVAVAEAKTVQFLSQHPVPHKFGSGFCYIEVPHVHNYAPGDPRMYRETNGQFYFVGDPSPFDYDGPRYSYFGSHPIIEAHIQFGHPVYCYIKGPHFHGYQPPPQAQFQLSGGAYWYVGNFPRTYYDERPRYAVINEAYAPMPYARPIVDVQVAPPMVRAEIAIGGPGWSASAVVGRAPAPVVFVPPPPPPPPPLPSPAIQIGVGINLGGPAIIERHEYIEERHHRDHGRHRGWREPVRFQEHRRREPQARFVPARAPVTRPLFQRAQPQRPAPGPSFAPAQRPAPAPAPMRGPAPAQPGRRDDHRQDRRP